MLRLSPGARLGPYEIVAAIGAGGMGEVYKARDTRLDRQVAIKTLTAAVASSSDARQRFEREARTVSQLSHPHICALYDVGQHDGTEYLVMELLEGETLAARLAKGPLPLDQTLRYALQIADALEHAHRHGVAHRDLKPANVMITRSGVKLLDFGLAKETQPFGAANASALETSPVPASLTSAGVFVGTLYYVAPEQLEGRSADARSDIFSFGATMFEMVTGRRAFDAASAVALASAILREQPPPVSSLRHDCPRSLERLIQACLAKAPDERWQTAHDVGLELASIVDDRSAGAAPAARRPTAGAPLVPWLVAAAALLSTVGFWLWRPALPPPAAAIRFAVPPPPGGAFSDTVETVCIALSPDGSQLAYVAADAHGDRRVWLRPLSANDPRPVPGTEGSRTVIWSPDGRSIAFFAGDKLKRLELPDGAPVTLSEVPDVGIFATWGAETDSVRDDPGRPLSGAGRRRSDGPGPGARPVATGSLDQLALVPARRSAFSCTW